MLAKAKSGHKLTGAAPYGYQRNPEERHRLVIDMSAANVVRMVFRLRAEAMGYTAIAGALNKDGIKPPRAGIWSTRTIKLMLSNEVYLGHTISLKRGTRSYRDSRKYRRDESEWIRVENTHQPIIDATTWDKVQRLNQAAKAKAVSHKHPKPSLFSGLLICSDCGAKMGLLSNAYTCRTHYRSGRAACSPHRISERDLKALVLSNIKEAADRMIHDEAAMQESLRRILLGRCKADEVAAAKERRQLEQQLFRLDNQIDKLCEDKAEGLIPAEDFYVGANKIEEQRDVLAERLSTINQVINETANKTGDIDKWIALIKEKSTLHEVDRDMLESLIDRIEIGEKQTINGVSSQDVKIFYKYVGLC